MNVPTSPGSSTHRPSDSTREGFSVLTDLVLIVLATVATVLLALLYGEQGGPAAVRVPLGFLFVFFLPGYAITSALYPARGTGDWASRGRTTINAFERLVLSVGLSIVGVPLVSVCLVLLSVDITLESVLGSVALLTVTAAVLAGVRRFRLPPDRRFCVSFGRYVTSGLDYASANVLNLLIVTGLVLAIAGAGVAITTSENNEQYTEFALLSAAENSDQLVADNYPTELTRGEPETTYTEIVNHEGQTVEYTLVVELQELTGPDETRTVTHSIELQRTTLSLGPEERTVSEQQITPTITGEDLRLTYLLYRGEPPADPTNSNAYRSVHLNVDVTG